MQLFNKWTITRLSTVLFLVLLLPCAVVRADIDVSGDVAPIEGENRDIAGANRLTIIKDFVNYTENDIIAAADLSLEFIDSDHADIIAVHTSDGRGATWSLDGLTPGKYMLREASAANIAVSFASTDVDIDSNGVFLFPGEADADITITVTSTFTAARDNTIIADRREGGSSYVYEEDTDTGIWESIEIPPEPLIFQPHTAQAPAGPREAAAAKETLPELPRTGANHIPLAAAGLLLTGGGLLLKGRS